MALRTFMYQDPSKIIEIKEQHEIGCLGCGWRKVDRKKQPHKPFCSADQGGFPDNTKLNCKWHKRKA